MKTLRFKGMAISTNRTPSIMDKWSQDSVFMELINARVNKHTVSHVYGLKMEGVDLFHGIKLPLDRVEVEVRFK